jgi:hypothetical protein
MAPNLRSTSLLVFLLALLGAPAAHATDYIVVRLDEVRLLDSGEIDNAELQYVIVASTGNHGNEAITVQTTTFPLAKWYASDEGGLNALFMGPHDQAVPIFAWPEDEMGEELTLLVTVVEDDHTSDAVIIGHAVAAKIGTAIATYYSAEGGAGVEILSSAVQRQIEDAARVDVLDGPLPQTLLREARDGSTFGIRRGEHSRVFEPTEGKNVWIKFSVLRVTAREVYADWCVSATLEKIKIVDDSDDGTQGDGDISIRARAADGYVAAPISQLDQHVVALPRSGERSVESGHNFPLGDPPRLYSNSRGSGREARCTGLPPFLFLEVDVFDDDDPSSDDTAVLPLFFTHRWLRGHSNRSTPIKYRVRGGGGLRADISVVVRVWDPHEDPDAPLSDRR